MRDHAPNFWEAFVGKRSTRPVRSTCSTTRITAVHRSGTGSAEEPVFKTALDLFSPSVRYIRSLRWKNRTDPPTGNLEAVEPNDTLYTTTNDPFPQVRCYEVTLRTEYGNISFGYPYSNTC